MVKGRVVKSHVVRAGLDRSIKCPESDQDSNWMDLSGRILILNNIGILNSDNFETRLSICS